MAEEQAAHHLLNVLEERGLDVDLDKILLGFEDENTKIDAAAWVEEYLQEDTLLTKEELELYQTLRRKGLLHQYESEGEPVRPILDHELSSAIESLQNSTAAIEEQCRVLEAQKDALVRLKALDKPNLEFEHLRNERRRKEGQEKARLDVAVDDVSAALAEQLNEAQRDVDLEKSTLKSYLAERLSSDDQILSRLPGIVSQIIAEDEVSEDEKSIEQWCKALVSFRTAEIKARVDAIFLDSLNPYGAQPEVSGADLNDQKAALQAEMEELHSEIASVAEMAVEHEIKKPLTEMRDRKNRDKTQARGAWLNYVLSTLQYMSKRLATINTNAADSDELHRALVHVSEAASKRMPTTSGVDLTPTKRRASGPLSAFTPMIKLKPTKGLDLPVALQDALRHTGVSFNQDSIEALQDSLMHVHLERSRTLQEHCVSSLASTHDKLAERSSRADADVRIILKALYKHTPFQEVNLTNQKLDELLKSMERDIEAKDRELLEAEGSQLSLGDPKVRAFIAKYGK